MEYVIEAHGRSYRIEAHPESRFALDLAKGFPYEKNLLGHIYKQGFKGTALDIGASIGNHSLYLAAVCGLTVHAFEPLTIGPLWENVRRNPDLDITVYPHALGAIDARASSVGKGKLEVGEGTVIVRSLDFYELAPSVIKIDVEDMEPDVLRGGEHTIRTHKPAIYAEARDEAAHEALAAVLEPWDYRHEMTASTSTPVEAWAYCR